MKREGSSLLSRWLGRMAYGPAPVRCVRCKQATTDARAIERLRLAGMERAAFWCRHCAACRAELQRDALRPG